MDKRLLDILNDSIARELAATIQYMWQHVMVKGLESPEIADIFKKTSITEMKHTEKLAERLDYFNGVPTTIPTKIQVGGDIKKMLQNNIAIEREAIALYKRAIKLCTELDDPVTRLMYEEILTDEEDHEYTFTTILGE